MTSNEAVDVLSKNWWKHYPDTFEHDNFEFKAGEKIKETLENDTHFPNSYIINATITKKNENDGDEVFFAVSKSTGDCQVAIYWQ